MDGPPSPPPARKESINSIGQLYAKVLGSYPQLPSVASACCTVFIYTCIRDHDMGQMEHFFSFLSLLLITVSILCPHNMVASGFLLFNLNHSSILTLYSSTSYVNVKTFNPRRAGGKYYPLSRFSRIPQ